MEAGAKTELRPEPAPSGSGLRARATGRQRLNIVLVLAVAGLLAPALLTVPVKLFAGHAQRLVSGALPGLRNGDDRVTAVAWMPLPDGPLVVGTQRGQVYRVTRDGSVTALSSEPGAIVALAPDRTGSVPRIVMRGGLSSTDAPLLYRVSGADKSLSFADASLALQLGSGPGYGVDVLSWRAAAEKEAGSKISVAAQFPGDTLSGYPASGYPRQSSRLESLVQPGTSRLVVGFADGQLRIPGNPVLQARDDPTPREARRPVVALTVDTSPTGPALVAAADVDGSATLLMVGVADVASVLSERAIGKPCRQVPTDRSSGTPAARPERLFLSWASGILVSHCTDGGVVVTRFPTSVGEGEITSQRLPLADLVADRPSLPSKGPAVREVQLALAVAGYDPGVADGVFGPRTRSMLDQFRQARGLADAAEGAVLDTLLGATWRVSAVTFSPVGDVLAVAGNDGIVRIATLSSTPGPTFSVSGHADTVTHIEISTDGRFLASAGLDGRVWMTDLEAARRRAGLPFYELATGPAHVEPRPVPLEGREEPQGSGSQGSGQGLGPQLARQQGSGAQPSGASGAAGDAIVVFGGDSSLAAAQVEVARAAQAGIAGGEIVLRDGSYRSIVRYPNAYARQRGLVQLRTLSAWSAGAYGRLFSAWCPNPVRLDGYTRCGEAARPAPAD